MAIRTTGGHEFTITEYIGFKRTNRWGIPHEQVKGKLNGETRIRSWNVENLTSDTTEELADALAQAKTRTVEVRMTDTRKKALLATYKANAIGETVKSWEYRGRVPESAFGWLQNNGLTEYGHLNPQAFTMAQQLFIAEQGISDFFSALAAFAKQQTGITGFFEVFKYAPTMLAIDRFAPDLPGWTVTPSYGGKTYSAAFTARGTIYITIRLNNFRRDDKPRYQADIKMSFEDRTELDVLGARWWANLLEEAATLMTRLNATLV